MPSRSRLLLAPLALLVLSLALAPAPARAASIIGSCPANPSLGCDDGAEIFIANANPNHGGAHIVLVQELADPVPSNVVHEWGFFFDSDPGTLIPIFDASDSASGQQAVIDFDNGVVVDLDASNVQSTFGASLASFGFYISVPNLGVQRYSLNALNPGGVDSFASFPLLANPLFRVVSFEVDEQIFSFEIVDGGIPVPEAGTGLLIAAGLTALAQRGRRARR